MARRDRRDGRVVVLLTADEKRGLVQLAGLEGVSLSVWLREAAVQKAKSLA